MMVMNPLFQDDSYPPALQLVLYQDAFEIVNPLGFAKKKYKILAVYMSCGNGLVWFIGV